MRTAATTRRELASRARRRSSSRDNTYAEHRLDVAPVEVRRSVITTAGLTVDRVARYLDTRPPEGLEKVQSLLDRLEAEFEDEFSGVDDDEFLDDGIELT